MRPKFGQIFKIFKKRRNKIFAAKQLLKKANFHNLAAKFPTLVRTVSFSSKIKARPVWYGMWCMFRLAGIAVSAERRGPPCVRIDRDSTLLVTLQHCRILKWPTFLRRSENHLSVQTAEGSVLTYSDPSLIFVFLVIFSASTITLCFLFSTLFSKGLLLSLFCLFFSFFLAHSRDATTQNADRYSTGH